MNITEQDIFLMVNFPEQVPEDKQDEILKNPLFAEALTYFRNMKEGVNSQSFENDNIIGQIFVESDNTVVDLYPEEIVNKASTTLFAAQNSSEENKLVARSYSASDNNVLIRIVKEESKLKVFTFMKPGMLLGKYCLRLHTGSSVLEIDTVTAELTIESNDFPSRIEITPKLLFE